MARKVDSRIFEIFEKYSILNKTSLEIFKRFLDDLFVIFNGSSKLVHKIFDEINNIHLNIKFTMNHTSIVESDPCNCPQKKYSIYRCFKNIVFVSIRN